MFHFFIDVLTIQDKLLERDEFKLIYLVKSVIHTKYVYNDDIQNVMNWCLRKQYDLYFTYTCPECLSLPTITD